LPGRGIDGGHSRLQIVFQEPLFIKPEALADP
jgi:hypothetical protein